MKKLLQAKMLIPQRYNDGTKVEKEFFTLFEHLLEGTFRGFTERDLARGSYFGQRENSRTYEVAIKSKDRPLFLKCADFVGRLLGQKEVLVEISDTPIVEMVDTSAKGGDVQLPTKQSSAGEMPTARSRASSKTKLSAKRKQKARHKAQPKARVNARKQPRAKRKAQ